MASSLGSLSSPSPSLSPPPTSTSPTKKSQAKSQTAATAPPYHSPDLSDLSELSDDDDDGAESSGKRGASASTSKAHAAEDDDSAPPSTSRAAKRGSHQRSLSAAARRGGPGRKKRGSLVSLKMWGWAEAKPPVAEEEEEMTDPPRMEEEEEDEEDVVEDDNETAEMDDDDERGGFVGQRRATTTTTYGTQRQQPGMRHARKHRGARREDGSGSGSEYGGTKRKRPPKKTRKRKEVLEAESSGSEQPAAPKPATAYDDEYDDMNDSDGSRPDLPDENLEQRIAESAISPTSALTALAAVAGAVEPVEPTPLQVASTLVAVASHSIMAGNIVEDPIIPSTSVDPTPADSPAVSDDEDEEDQPRTTRRAPPPRAPLVNGAKKQPLDLKINTVLGDIPDKPIIAGDDMEVDAAEDDAVDVDMEGEPLEPDEEDEPDEGEEEVDDASQVDEDEAINADEDEEEEAPDADEEEIGDGDDEAAEVDGDDEQEADVAEAQEEVENDENPSRDGEIEDQEIELQPAHRAEALDVLATIELKFALLRERVYVEKMENLAWEEKMVQAAGHPEMLHLHKELSRRRDKRLELASRKRAYEVENAGKRRRAEEEAVYGWWKLSRDELQTTMIAETNRKRRKLERERRNVERPQPIRRIPAPPIMDLHYPPPHAPSMRKILKSYPFGTRKHNKSDRLEHHPHSLSQNPKTYVYPEVMSLNANDIATDLDFLFQNRRPPAGFEQPFGGPAPWGGLPFGQRTSSLGPGSGPPGFGRSGLGPGLSNGLSNSMMAPPPPPMMHPPMGQEQYNDGPQFGGPPGPGRMRDGPPYPPGPPPNNGRDGMNGYSTFSGPPPRNHGPSQHGYPPEPEMSTMGPSSGTGHQLMPHHPYFSQGSVGPPGSGNQYPPTSSHGHGKGPMNGRRSPSPPPPPMQNGASSSKSNGNWVGPSMGMGTFHLGGKGGDRDMRPTHEDEERERIIRDRKRDKDMDRREQERDIERRHREREYPPHTERDRREREHQHPPPRQGQPPSSSHNHFHPNNAGGGPPPPGNPDQHHHHHHRHPHHHHVLHRHGPPHASSSLPAPAPSGPVAPPITHSPRSGRDYDRQPPIHTGPSGTHPTEMIMLSSNNSKPPSSRDREPPGHWSHKNGEDPHQLPDYRDREREQRERDRKPYSSRPPSRPPMTPLDGVEDRGERPIATPFVMAPSSSSHINGNGTGSSTSSPRHPSWNTTPLDDGYRSNPPGYHDRSPLQSQRFPPGGTPLNRGMPGGNSSSSLHRMGSPPPPGRPRPPQSPSSYGPGHPTSHRSPVTSPKARPISPIQTNSKPIVPSSVFTTPRLPGPGPPRASSPPSAMPSDPVMKNGSSKYPPPPSLGSSRTASPLMSSLHPPSSSSRPMASVNGIGTGGMGSGPGVLASDPRDSGRHAVAVLSPRLGGSSMALPPPPSKLSAAQTVEGR